MSHEAAAWAVRQIDAPLDERMMLVYLADAHCPDNGCQARPERLAVDAGISPAECLQLPGRLEARGKICRVADTERWILEFEQSPNAILGRAAR